MSISYCTAEKACSLILHQLPATDCSKMLLVLHQAERKAMPLRRPKQAQKLQRQAALPREAMRKAELLLPHRLHRCLATLLPCSGDADVFKLRTETRRPHGHGKAHTKCMHAGCCTGAQEQPGCCTRQCCICSGCGCIRDQLARHTHRLESTRQFAYRTCLIGCHPALHQVWHKLASLSTMCSK